MRAPTERTSARPALLILVAFLALAGTLGAVAATAKAPAAARRTEPTAQAAGGPQVFGLSDQDDPRMFSDQLFKRLQVQATRFVADWNVALRPGRERNLVDAWYRGALRAHIQPLLSFGEVETTGTPTGVQFGLAFRAALARWPQMEAWETWNEANNPGQHATYDDPAKAARLAHLMRRICRTCRILPLSIVLEGGPQSEDRWIAAWERAYGGPPAVWAVHDYADPNFFTTKSLSSFLSRHPTGDVWLTEEGAFAKFSVQFPWNLRRQAAAAEWVVRDAIAFRRRVRRVYYYQWLGLPYAHRKVGWDTALLDARGNPRPAYEALLRWRPKLR